MNLDSFLDKFFDALKVKMIVVWYHEKDSTNLKGVLRSAHDLNQRGSSRVSFRSDIAGVSVERKSPEALCEELDIDLGTQTIDALSFEELFALLQATLRNSVNTNSPLFLNRLFSGAELAGVLAEYLVCAINTSAVSFVLFLFCFVFMCFQGSLGCVASV
jgi:hypothetical protein